MSLKNDDFRALVANHQPQKQVPEASSTGNASGGRPNFNPNWQQHPGAGAVFHQGGSMGYGPGYGEKRQGGWRKLVGVWRKHGV